MKPTAGFDMVGFAKAVCLPRMAAKEAAREQEKDGEVKGATGGERADEAAEVDGAAD